MKTMHHIIQSLGGGITSIPRGEKSIRNCCLFKICLLLIGLLASNLFPAQAAIPVVTTDQADYPPGATANISGSGFQAGESVQLLVLHAGGTSDNDTSPAHQPWTVPSDANGAFITSWTIPADEDELGAVLTVTAVGQSSGLTAQFLFLDSNGSVVFSQPFEVNVAPTFQLTAWNTFRSQLTTDHKYTKVTILGTFDPIGVSISDSDIVSSIASALRTLQPRTWVFGGHTWRVGTNCVAPGQPNNAELAVDEELCGCSDRYSIRPAIGNASWGGVNTGTCFFSTKNQTMTVIFEFQDADVNNPPVAKCKNVVVPIEANCSANASIDDGSSDPDAGDTISITQSPAGPYALGQTTVTLTVTDSHGASSQCTAIVTVVDKIKPVLVLKGSAGTMTVECHTSFSDPGAAAFDNCAGSLPISVSGSVDVNTPGTYTLSYSATDSSGNSETITRTVLVVDTTKPLVSLNGESTISLETHSTFSDPGATAADSCAGPLPVTVSGAVDVNTPGTYVLSYSATDPSGNIGTATRTVVVGDTTPPVLSLPESIIAEATSSAGAAVTFKASANDLVDGPTAVLANPLSGSTFPIGTTTVNVSSTDSHANTATGSFTVTVRDSTPPVIRPAAEIVIEATSAAGASVSYNILADDLVDGVISAIPSIPSGSMFPPGSTTVLLTATDAHGNQSQSSLKVTVRDTTPPVIRPASDLVLEAFGPAGTAASYNIVADDLVDGVVSAIPSIPSGSIFPLGTTKVVLTATDAHGNESQASFKVTVRDTTPPVTRGAHDLVLEAISPAGAPAAYEVLADDLIDGVVPVIPSVPSGSIFPLGISTVLLIATDTHGNQSQGSFNVTVRDTTPPVITCPADISIGSSVDLLVPVTFPPAVVSDIADPNPRVTYSLPSGSGFRVGRTTVIVTATDASGNVATCSFNVTRKALDFTGFSSPVGGADETGGSFAAPLRAFKYGSTIPIKFSAASNGLAVTTGNHKLQIVKYSDLTTGDSPIDASPQEAVTTGNLFLHLTGTEWHYNLSTKISGVTPGIWQIAVTLSDGSQHKAWIQIK